MQDCLDHGTRLDVTHEELGRIKKAFDDPKFRELFSQYAEEISSPENRKKYEQELHEMERQRGMQVEFLHPVPDYCLKTRVWPSTSSSSSSPPSTTDNKIFINICREAKLAEPTNNSSSSSPPIHWTIPHCFIPPRQDVDKRGNAVTIYDVAFHPRAFDLAASDVNFAKLIDSTAIEGLQRHFGLRIGLTPQGADQVEQALTALQRSPRSSPSSLNHSLLLQAVRRVKGTKYKGSTPQQPTVIRRQSSDYDLRQTELRRQLDRDLSTLPSNSGDQRDALIRLAALNNPPPPSPSATNVPPNASSNWHEISQRQLPINQSSINQQQPPHSPLPTITPCYRLVHSSDFNMSDMTNPVASTNPTPPPPSRRRPERLVLTVELPGLTSASDMELDVAPNQITLSSDPPLNYRLDLQLPFEVLDSQSEAKFNTDTSKLTLKLKVKPLPPPSDESSPSSSNRRDRQRPPTPSRFRLIQLSERARRDDAAWSLDDSVPYVAPPPRPTSPLTVAADTNEDDNQATLTAASSTLVPSSQSIAPRCSSTAVTSSTASSSTRSPPFISPSIAPRCSSADSCPSSSTTATTSSITSPPAPGSRFKVVRVKPRKRLPSVRDSIDSHLLLPEPARLPASINVEVVRQPIILFNIVKDLRLAPVRFRQDPTTFTMLVPVASILATTIRLAWTPPPIGAPSECCCCRVGRFTDQVSRLSPPTARRRDLLAKSLHLMLTFSARQHKAPPKAYGVIIHAPSYPSSSSLEMSDLTIKAPVPSSSDSSEIRSLPPRRRLMTEPSYLNEDALLLRDDEDIGRPLVTRATLTETGLVLVLRKPPTTTIDDRQITWWSSVAVGRCLAAGMQDCQFEGISACSSANQSTTSPIPVTNSTTTTVTECSDELCEIVLEPAAASIAPSLVNEENDSGSLSTICSVTDDDICLVRPGDLEGTGGVDCPVTSSATFTDQSAAVDLKQQRSVLKGILKTRSNHSESCTDDLGCMPTASDSNIKPTSPLECQSRRSSSGWAVDFTSDLASQGRSLTDEEDERADSTSATTKVNFAVGNEKVEFWSKDPVGSLHHQHYRQVSSTKEIPSRFRRRRCQPAVSRRHSSYSESSPPLLPVAANSASHCHPPQSSWTSDEPVGFAVGPQSTSTSSSSDASGSSMVTVIERCDSRVARQGLESSLVHVYRLEPTLTETLLPDLAFITHLCRTASSTTTNEVTSTHRLQLARGDDLVDDLDKNVKVVAQGEAPPQPSSRHPVLLARHALELDE